MSSGASVDFSALAGSVSPRRRRVPAPPVVCRLTYGVCRIGTEPGCRFSGAVSLAPLRVVPPDPNEPVTGVVQTLTVPSDRSNGVDDAGTPEAAVARTKDAVFRDLGDLDERPEMALVGNRR